MKLEQTECSETLVYKIQTPGNYPEESTQHSEHDESLTSVEFTNSLEETMTSSFRAELKIEAARSPKTLLNFYLATR